MKVDGEKEGRYVMRRETERDRTKARLTNKRIANRAKSLPGSFRKSKKAESGG